MAAMSFRFYLLLDLDSTVVTSFGHQEDAEDVPTCRITFKFSGNCLQLSPCSDNGTV
jgi:hypothetical protein